MCCSGERVLQVSRTRGFDRNGPSVDLRVCDVHCQSLRTAGNASAFRSFNAPGDPCSCRQSHFPVNDDILIELHRNGLAGGINGRNVMQCAHYQRCASGNCNREGGLHCQASNACGDESNESSHLPMVRSRMATAYWTLDLYYAWVHRFHCMVLDRTIDFVAASCADFTQRNPRWFVPVFTSPLPRVPTI